MEKISWCKKSSHIWTIWNCLHFLTFHQETNPPAKVAPKLISNVRSNVETFSRESAISELLCYVQVGEYIHFHFAFKWGVYSFQQVGFRQNCSKVDVQSKDTNETCWHRKWSCANIGRSFLVDLNIKLHHTSSHTKSKWTIPKWDVVSSHNVKYILLL